METGTVVGTVTSGDEMPLPESKAERKVRKVMRAKTSSQVLPAHLVDLDNRPSEGLTEVEKDLLSRIPMLLLRMTWTWVALILLLVK